MCEYKFEQVVPVWSSNFQLGSVKLGSNIYATNFLRPSVDIDFGRSSGRPMALDQIIWEKHPNARETPNNTV